MQSILKVLAILAILFTPQIVSAGDASLDSIINADRMRAMEDRMDQIEQQRKQEQWDKIMDDFHRESKEIDDRFNRQMKDQDLRDGTWTIFDDLP